MREKEKEKIQKQVIKDIKEIPDAGTRLAFWFLIIAVIFLTGLFAYERTRNISARDGRDIDCKELNIELKDENRELRSANNALNFTNDSLLRVQYLTTLKENDKKQEEINQLKKVEREYQNIIKNLKDGKK